MSRSRSLTIGAVISLMILLIAAMSFIWVPYDVTQLSIPDKLQRPNWTTGWARIILDVICFP